jgi:mannose/fructose/N-acetylgalactosamine-specific phosphotransferase system component IID
MQALQHFLDAIRIHITNLIFTALSMIKLKHLNSSVILILKFCIGMLTRKVTVFRTKWLAHNLCPNSLFINY